MMNEACEKPPRDLPPDTLLYRAIRASQWVSADNQYVDPGAFVRRPGVDDKGLSVILNPVCSPGIKNREGCAATLAKCYGELEIEASVVYALNLGVKIDQDLHNKANITHVPCKTEDEDKAEHVAGELAKHCRIHLRTREAQ